MPPDRHVDNTGSTSSFSGPLRIVVERGFGDVSTYARNSGTASMPLRIGDGNSTCALKVLFCSIERFSVFASLMKMLGSCAGSCG
jgi:hypothetical protein